MDQNEIYDAIVVGTGLSGSWAAKELTKKGLKTLVLERGRMLIHIEDYPTMRYGPWDYPLKGKLSCPKPCKLDPKKDVKHFFGKFLPYDENRVKLSPYRKE